MVNVQKHSGSTLTKTNSIFVEDESCCEKEPNGESDDNNYRKHVPTIVTQHQQQFPYKTSSGQSERTEAEGQHSLYIPARDDEDNKSQHSRRTISSSRRQSTEDSIDTDDEYYCYELRKLKELENESKLEQIEIRTMANEEANKSLFSKIGALNKNSEVWYAFLFHTFPNSFDYSHLIS